MSGILSTKIATANQRLAEIAPDIPPITPTTVTCDVIRSIVNTLTSRRIVGGPDYVPAIRAVDSIRYTLIQEKTASLRMLTSVNVGDTVPAGWLDQLQTIVYSEAVTDYRVDPTPTGSQMSGRSPKKYSFAIVIAGTGESRVGTITTVTIGSG